MKSVILITILILTSIVSKAQWDKTQETRAIAVSYNVAKSYGLSDTESAQYANCSLTALKYKIPSFDKFRGTGEDAKKLGLEAGMECLDKFNLKWTPALETNIRILILQNKDIQKLSEEIKIRFADCGINTLKSLYPNGVFKVSKDIAEAVGKQCMTNLMKNQ